MERDKNMVPTQKKAAKKLPCVPCHPVELGGRGEPSTSPRSCSISENGTFKAETCCDSFLLCGRVLHLGKM